MLSADLRKLLIAQIGNELAAHRCTSRSPIYFERQSLDGWGKLFHEQSIEEAQHAQKIIDFLVDNDVDFDLPALKATSTRFDSPASAARNGAGVGADRRGAVRPRGGRRGRLGRPPWVRVPPVVHRRAGRGGDQAAARRRPRSRAGSTCSRPKRCSRRSSRTWPTTATITWTRSRSALACGSMGRSTSPIPIRAGRRYTSMKRRGSGALGDGCSCSSTRGRRPCPGSRRSRSSTSCWSSPTRPTSPPMSRTGGGWLHPADPRAGLARAPGVQGPGHGRQPARLRADSSEIERMLAFRDWLRTHDDERDLYQRNEARARRPRLGLRPGLRRREGRGRRGDHRPGAARRASAPTRVDIERATRYRPTTA